MAASAVRAVGSRTSRMAAACSGAPRPKAASKGPAAGPAGVLPCLELPSYAAACALLNGRYSCLVAGPHRRHLALSPRYLQRKRTGIREQLDAELLRYSESLSGVPIAYDNIKVVGELGDIYDDQGYIHLTIEADFVIFCPEPGQKLVGTVNKVSLSHIGCLVHGCFNASIPKPEQMPAEQWQSLEISVGDELEFEVFRLDSDAAGVFCIRGKLSIASLHTKCSAAPEEVAGPGPEEVPEKPLKKKKKKRKDLELHDAPEPAGCADIAAEGGTDSQVNGSENGPWDEEEEPRKKKKKKRRKDPELDEGAGGASERAGSADVPAEEGTDPQVNGGENGPWDEDEEPPKKKKKTKKKRKDLELDEGAGGAPERAGCADVPAEGGMCPQVNGGEKGPWDEEEEPRKKKKRKQRHLDDGDQDAGFAASDSSGYQSDHKKKRKKRKLSEGAELAPLGDHSPGKKRKR